MSRLSHILAATALSVAASITAANATGKPSSGQNNGNNDQNQGVVIHGNGNKVDQKQTVCSGDNSCTQDSSRHNSGNIINSNNPTTIIDKSKNNSGNKDESVKVGVEVEGAKSESDAEAAAKAAAAAEAKIGDVRTGDVTVAGDGPVSQTVNGGAQSLSVNEFTDARGGAFAFAPDPVAVATDKCQRAFGVSIGGGTPFSGSGAVAISKTDPAAPDLGGLTVREFMKLSAPQRVEAAKDLGKNDRKLFACVAEEVGHQEAEHAHNERKQLILTGGEVYATTGDAGVLHQVIGERVFDPGKPQAAMAYSFNSCIFKAHAEENGVNNPAPGIGQGKTGVPDKGAHDAAAIMNCEAVKAGARAYFDNVWAPK